MAPTANTVLITVPRTAITSNNLPKLRPAPLTAALLKAAATPSASPTPSSSGYASSSNMDDDNMAASQPKAKKRRLDHLTWEEKVQRKKLKNRVAAQTSRDRKKARMEEMDYEIKELTDKTEILQNKCDSLQAINESLLAKNHKLDSELELLRQELAELKQQQQHNTRCISQSNASAGAEGCASTNLGSAASKADSAAGYTTGGHTVVSASAGGATEEQQEPGLTLESCGPLPTLQDMLGDDEEFDVKRLEELAESLLADITADLETGAGASSPAASEDAGNAERLLGPMVGPAAERLESDGHRANGLKVEQKQETEHKVNLNVQVLEINGNPQNPTAAPRTATIRATAAASLLQATPDTVYGTYDAKTNSITIVMDGDAVPVNEAVEEIYCDGVSAGDDSTDVIMKCPPPATSPSQVYLNVMNATDDSDDESFDPIDRFLRPRVKAISPLAKSPALSLHSAISDHGYESILGSPMSAALTMPADEDDFPWESNFDELFPSLI
ncbi:LOW QUALITY PROTEIN: uncharacterized protein LOC120445042 [Drosophila santomea]|uniref:LOW QUALITY PROTEIN: uncharacterized protein LOC120445042 n=1 Tax=Drosophila santomea TaxID=129105 RepID=UPI00195375C9|nr:LOW QUALITY PROTEIN: uncharacterized protein LOC120445042 [Drosophila santomea]